jgi:hypothetical protein
MTANEVISRARGECRHYVTWPERGANKHKFFCKKCKRVSKTKHDFNLPPDYENDPRAWDTALFDWIEGEGLTAEFQYWLYTLLKNESEITCVKHSLVIGSVMMWYMLKSTPAQKSEALKLAILEVS